MVLKEVSVERLAFACATCGNTWFADYDVQHVEDGYGHDRDYYFRDGLACPDPTAPAAELCSGCGHARVTVTLVARRASPAVSATTAGDLGSRPTTAKAATRHAAPLLPATRRTP